MTRAHEIYSSYSDDQRAFFDELITTDWETYSNSAWDRARRFEVAALLRSLRPRTVLDVGCGCGFHDVLFAESPSVERVDAIDPSARSVDVAETHFAHPAVHRRVGNVFAEPPGEYDLVVAFQVIEHLPDPLGFLVACAAQTRRGGHVAIATPNRRRLNNRVRELFRRPPLLVDNSHFRELSIAELSGMGESAGLEVERVAARGLSVYLPRSSRQIVPSRLGLRLGALVPPAADVFCCLFRRV